MSARHESGAEQHPQGHGRMPDNGTTGFPGLRTWPQLYAFVLGCFVLWLVLLFALGLIFR